MKRFANDARPRGLIETPKAMDEAEIADFLRRWKSTHESVPTYCSAIARLREGTEILRTGGAGASLTPAECVALLDVLGEG